MLNDSALGLGNKESEFFNKWCNYKKKKILVIPSAFTTEIGA